MSNFNYCPLVWMLSNATSLKKIENLQERALRLLYNNLNHNFMKQIFELRKTNRNIREKYRLNLNIHNYNQVTFGKMSLRIFGPKIWNTLPCHIKSSQSLETFKTVIKNWDGVNCKCVICKKL